MSAFTPNPADLKRVFTEIISKLDEFYDHAGLDENSRKEAKSVLSRSRKSHAKTFLKQVAKAGLTFSECEFSATRLTGVRRFASPTTLKLSSTLTATSNQDTVSYIWKFEACVPEIPGQDDEAAEGYEAAEEAQIPDGSQVATTDSSAWWGTVLQ